MLEKRMGNIILLVRRSLILRPSDHRDFAVRAQDRRRKIFKILQQAHHAMLDGVAINLVRLPVLFILLHLYQGRAALVDGALCRILCGRHLHVLERVLDD